MGTVAPSVGRMVRRSIVALVLGAGVTVDLDATTLAIIRTSREVVIAADSLLTLYDNRPQQACKIRRSGNVVFATAGLVESSAGMLDTHQVITQVLRRNVTWTEHVSTIQQRLQEPLLRTLRRMQRELPDQFIRQIRRGFALHVSLATFRHGTPVLDMLEFFVEPEDGGTFQLQIRRVSCPGDCSPGTNVFGVGETATMMRHVNGLRRFPPDLGGLARELVSLQIRDTPTYVGPPIDVIRIDAGGVQWSARKTSCPA